jgi:oxaloacetate decarboxylase beta subunit
MINVFPQNPAEIFVYTGIGLKEVIMIILGLFFIYLAIKKEFEPLLLVPIGFGIILTNLGGGMGEAPYGLLYLIRKYLIDTEIIPCLIFLGLGAMTDFTPLLARPMAGFILGAAVQIGIFCAFLMALTLGFPLKQAASIGIIGSADGPTTIYTCTKLAPEILGVVAISAYIYMALVPLIQPPIIYALTTKKERATYMAPTIRKVSKLEKILFPIVLVLIACTLAPQSTPLIGSLAVGNLFKESGVVGRLAESARNEIMNVSTILLGLGVGGTLMAERFLTIGSLMIFGLGIFAFATATIAGVLFGKIVYLATGKKVNPIIGAAGVSAVPMSARVCQVVARKANPRNYLLMHAMGPNVAGVIGSATAAGMLIALLG